MNQVAVVTNDVRTVIGGLTPAEAETMAGLHRQRLVAAGYAYNAGDDTYTLGQSVVAVRVEAVEAPK